MKVFMRIVAVREERVPVGAVGKMLDSLDRALTISFKEQSDHKKKDALPFAVVIDGTKKGSLGIELDIHTIALGSQAAFGFMTVASPLQIWENFTQTLEFLQAWSSLRDKGNSVVIEVTNSPGAKVFVNAGNGHITVPESALMTAPAMRDAIRPMLVPLSRKDAASVEFSRSGQPAEVQLTHKDRDLADVEFELAEEREEMHAEIESFDKSKKAGRCRVIIDYRPVFLRFKLRAQALVQPTLSAFQKGTCRMTVQREYVDMPDGTQKTVGLLVMAIS